MTSPHDAADHELVQYMLLLKIMLMSHASLQAQALAIMGSAHSPHDHSDAMQRLIFEVQG